MILPEMYEKQLTKRVLGRLLRNINGIAALLVRTVLRFFVSGVCGGRLARLAGLLYPLWAGLSLVRRVERSASAKSQMLWKAGSTYS